MASRMQARYLIKIQQLENDLAACRKHREEDEKEISNLRSNYSHLSSVVASITTDRDDWKSAYKLIMRLLK
jgi:hypothetical protein